MRCEFLRAVCAALFLLTACGAPAWGQTLAAQPPKKATVVVIPVRDQIADPVHFVLRRGIKEAMQENVDAIVIDMNTPGGSGAAAFEMMEAIAKFPGETITYINTEAMSAGAFIAAATEEIWFAPRAIIGAAAAVNATGEDIPETMRLKITSFLRAKIRAVSEGKPHRGQVISAMIDKDYELKIDDKVLKKPGELLSLTAEEAMAPYGTPPHALLGSGIAKDLTALLDAKYGAGNYSVKHLEVTWSEKLAQHLTNLSPLLLGLGLLALFVEFKTPGFGVFGVAGIVLLGLVFVSSYVAGLSGHEPILFFALGLLLVAAEIFFFPGVVIPALTGLVLMLGSLVWAMADLWPHEPIRVSGDAFVQPLVSLGVGLLVAVASAILLARFLPRGWIWDRMILNSAVTGNAQSDTPSSTAASREDSLIGKHGVAATGLFPTGQVVIEGRRYEARVAVGSVQQGESVVVVRRNEFDLLVQRKSP